MLAVDPELVVQVRAGRPSRFAYVTDDLALPDFATCASVPGKSLHVGIQRTAALVVLNDNGIAITVFAATEYYVPVAGSLDGRADIGGIVHAPMRANSGEDGVFAIQVEPRGNDGGVDGVAQKRFAQAAAFGRVKFAFSVGRGVADRLVYSAVVDEFRRENRAVGDFFAAPEMFLVNNGKAVAFFDIAREIDVPIENSGEFHDKPCRQPRSFTAVKQGRVYYSARVRCPDFQRAVNEHRLKGGLAAFGNAFSHDQQPARIMDVVFDRGKPAAFGNLHPDPVSGIQVLKISAEFAGMDDRLDFISGYPGGIAKIVQVLTVFDGKRPPCIFGRRLLFLICNGLVLLQGSPGVLTRGLRFIAGEGYRRADHRYGNRAEMQGEKCRNRDSCQDHNPLQVPAVGDTLPDIVTFTFGLMRLHGVHHSFKMLIFFIFKRPTRSVAHCPATLALAREPECIGRSSKNRAQFSVPTRCSIPKAEFGPNRVTIIQKSPIID